jgi:DNA-binding MarR family transcriptional regulator
MSIKITTLIWEYAIDVSGSTLLVLLALSDQANDEGICQPSIGTIAHKARITKSQAINYIQLLENNGYLEVKRNFLNPNKIVSCEIFAYKIMLGNVTGKKQEIERR